ncbi:Iron-binding zinc finger CDGSH type [Rhizoctonia solani]|uniref:Iron-binding zinc finger CDGSH type n=1 Tax=Rhizoctonia solani TaxID=456999 RepID=A0A8H7LXM0_9AGAM|nr:Iron-binding zinc finger CDGSH type [Rhizoctonia solani]
MSQHVGVSTQPVYKAPTGAPKEWTLTALRQHLQTAVILELYTIPLYLFAMYSINTDNAGSESPEQVAVAGVRMLHLILAGNLLTAVRGRPQLYGEAFAPKYPSEILYEGVLLTLAPAHPYQFQNFVEVEQPVDEKVEQEENLLKTKMLAQYESIGQFYGSLKEGLRDLHNRLGDDIFDKDSAKRQWGDDDPWFQGELAAITDLQTAEDKLSLIIEQGEGGPPTTGSSSSEQSHYEIFKKLSELNLNVHKLAPNPDTKQFEGREKSYPVMLAFDASTIKKKRAGPPFNIYLFSTETSPLNELKAIVANAISAYPDASELKGVPGAVGKLFDLGDI